MTEARRTLAPMAAWNAAAWVAGAAYGFVTSALLVRAVGDSGYGVWAAVGALRGFVMFLDGGLAFGVSRDAALGEGADSRIRAAWRLYAMLAGVAVGLALVAAPFAASLLHLEGSSAGAARDVTMLLGADTALALLGSPLLSILRGRQRFGGLAAASVGQTVVGVALLLVLLPRWGVVGAATAALGARAATLVGTAAWMRGAGLFPRGAGEGTFADVFRFAAPLWMISLATQIGMGMDTLVVGGFHGADVAGRYAQGSALPTIATGVLFAITGAAFPRMVAASPTEPRRWIGAQFFMASFLAAIGFGFLALHEDSLLTVWIGHASLLSVQVAAVVGLAWTLNAPAHVLSNLAIARGVHGVLGPVVACEALANLGLTIWLAAAWSPVGAAVATLATIFVSNVFVVPALLRPRVELTRAAIWRPTLFGWGFGVAGAFVVRALTFAVGGPALVTSLVGAAATVLLAGLVLEATVRGERPIVQFGRLLWRGGYFVLRDQAAEVRRERDRLAKLRRESPVVWIPEKPPLVTVRIATYNRGRLVADRAIASALAQSHANVEVLVVGDCCDQATADAVLSVKDPRVKFVNLAQRGRYPADPELRWMVAGEAPMNHALEIARGEWIAPLDDDDEFTVDHVEALLDACRTRNLEFVYGAADCEHRDGTWTKVGEWPPQHGKIIHAAVMWSARIRLRHDIRSWRINEPGDWNLWHRMRDAGVPMGYVDRVVCRHYVERREIKPVPPFWSGDR